MKTQIHSLLVFCLTCWTFMLPTAAMLKAYPPHDNIRIAAWIVVGLFSMAVGAFVVDHMRAKPAPAKSRLTLFLIGIALLIWAITSAAIARGDDDADYIWTSCDEVKCSALKPDFTFVEGCRGACGFPSEAFMRLVAVQGPTKYMLNTRTSLVGFVRIDTGPKALDFVRLFSKGKTHYLFDDADFLELPPYVAGSPFWHDVDSANRARISGIPIDDPPVEVAESNGTYRITRYGMDWDRHVLKVTEMVGANGAYAITERQILAHDVWTLMPVYE